MFKVGDKVRVVVDAHSNVSYVNGATGSIIEILWDVAFPFQVMLDKQGYRLAFRGSEITLVEPADEIDDIFELLTEEFDECDADYEEEESDAFVVIPADSDGYEVEAFDDYLDAFEYARELSGLSGGTYGVFKLVAEAGFSEHVYGKREVRFFS